MTKLMKNWLGNEAKITGICAALSALALVFSITGLFSSFLPFDIAWLAVLFCGIPILVGAFCGLVFEHDIKADVLVSLALIASVFIKEYFAAGEVALIMQIGSLLEDFTSARAKKGIEKLVKLSPQTACIFRDGVEKVLPAEEVRAGDQILVRAGETIPVDGLILSGETSIDQSVMTGESIPVDKKAGDKVSSGTVNQFGTFTMKATALCADSSLQRMIRLAREADENKAPIVSLADKWATWLVVIALLCAAGTWIITGEFIRAVTVLVVFCPCAFILATPTAVMAGIANAAKHGILIRSGDALERLSKVTKIAFDKTGTLTKGKPSLIFYKSLSPDFSDEEILSLSASGEKRSEHPLGKAIVLTAEEKNLNLIEVSDFSVKAGKGICAACGGKRLLLGKADFMTANGIDLTSSENEVLPYLESGATVVYLASGNVLAGFLALSDTLRESAMPALASLNKEGISAMLLTGDNENAASFVAKKLGIQDFKANLLPEDKLSALKKAREEGEIVCMAGDGVNDALALSCADAGIAMGGVGSDIAVESADAVLVSDDIGRLPYLFRLVRKVMKKIQVNIILSLIINISAVVLSALGLLTPITGALWHNAGSVFVVVNAVMLLAYGRIQK